jgi:23S rRNA pseudouridine2605 synthase
VRLNQFLARAGLGSRREADGWIRDGRVLVNGTPPRGMGASVTPGTDRVTLDGSPVALTEIVRYIAYHKPRGLLVSRKSQGGHPTIFQTLGERVRGLHAIGRLDLDSEGLLLLTNDGDLSEALLHPRSAILRRYRVWVRPEPGPEAIQRLTKGTLVAGVHVAPLRVKRESSGRGWAILVIELREGKKREVRALAKAAGLTVTRLVRTRFGSIELGTLRPGGLRPLERGEVAALRRDAFRRPPPGATLR